MTVTSGFFNHINNDRSYDAQQMGDIFEGIVTEGVLSTAGEQFLVSASSDMSVLVGSGKAWCLNTWINNDNPILLTLSDSFATLNRIDTIVLNFDRRDQTRDNTIIVVEGALATNPSPPTLIDEVDRKQLPICDIYVGAGVVSIVQGNITNRAGTVDSPWAANPLDHVTTESLLVQWQYQFDTWFANVQDNLDSNTETNLLARINELQSSLLGRNLLINGAMKVAQERPWSGLTAPISGDTGYVNTAPDMWVIQTPTTGSYSSTQHSEGGKEWYRTDVLSDAGAYAGTDLLFVKQYIEGARLQNILKGTPNAKDLSLSFTFQTNKAGTYILEIKDIDNARAISKELVVAPGSLNAPINVTWVIPADTVGGFDDDVEKSLYFGIIMSAGSNYTVGSLQTSWASVVAADRAVGVTQMGVTGDYAMFTDVQLEISPIPTHYDEVSYDVELERCMRYFESGIQVGSLYTIKYDTNNFSELYLRGKFKVAKRAEPTMPDIPGSNPGYLHSLANSAGPNNPAWDWEHATPATWWYSSNADVYDALCKHQFEFYNGGTSDLLAIATSLYHSYDLTFNYEADAQLY